MTQAEIIEYNKLCAEFLGCKIDYNVADWSKHADKSLTEHWNNDDNTYVHVPKGKGLPWYKVKHRGEFYQLFTDFTYQKLKESDIELGGSYNGAYYELKDMQFHSDWNWIMEVVEAIENKNINGYPFVFTIQIHDVFIENPMVLDNSYVVQSSIKKSKKEAVVQAINQFLIWYNQNKTV